MVTPVKFPGSVAWQNAADLAEDLADVDFEELTWEEAASIVVKFCNSPAVIFASRFCDVVRGSGGGDQPPEEEE